MRKTAMIELRDKLLEEYQNLKEPSHNHEYLNGYREAVKIAYQEIIDMIELNFETAGELGGGITEAQSIINRIEEFKKRAKENF